MVIHRYCINDNERREDTVRRDQLPSSTVLALILHDSIYSPLVI